MTDYTKIKCPKCGSTKFKVEVTEIFCVTGDFKKKKAEIEDEYTHDLEYEYPVRCADCDTPIDEVEGNEVYDLAIGAIEWRQP